MQIKEIEKLTGMERANIRFYEKEGLISPKRMDNGYRDYSENDLQILLRIKLLRSLHISLEEINALKDGNKDLVDTLSKQIRKLEQEKQDASYAQDVCFAMQRDRVSFGNLDAKKYLDGIDQVTKESGSTYFSIKDDELRQVFHPWRRFFARTLDIAMYNVLWSVFLAIAFQVNLVTRSHWGNILDSIVALVLMLLLEPIWLNLFGTTPGKAIFGLRIENPDGSHLSYGQGLGRTLGVLASGMGFYIPIYSLIRLWESYKLCTNSEVQPWDYSISYTIKDTKGYRGALYIGSRLALFAIIFTIMSAQQNIPPNRGDLTVEEFVENHNYYAENFDVSFGNEYLNEKGEWTRIERQGMGFSNIGKSEYNFTIENGYITGISFPVDMENETGWYVPDDTQMVLASLAFASAQEEIGLFSRVPNRIVNQINIYEDFQFIEAGITFTYTDSEFSIEK